VLSHSLCRLLKDDEEEMEIRRRRGGRIYRRKIGWVGEEENS
jgi:hypothetical protein